ncbi:MAG: M48 family metalloprotease [Bacilli bacterium]|nr:M48 family metalloprotease [Bacilli bacterium]
MKSKVLGVSLFTVTCLYGLLAGIIILATMIMGGNVLIAIGISIFIIAIQFLIAPWLTDLSMRFFYKAKFDKEIPEYLKKFIEEECAKHKVKYPKIGIIEDGAPNAFTYGRTKKDARLVLTRGIFDLLTEEEVKAVVGHEMGHIVHMDMLVMTAVQVVPLVMYAIFELLADNRSSSDSDDNKAAIVGYIAFVLYIISQYFILWLSRTREYYADEFSVQETKNPKALAEALVKIGFGLSTVTHENKDNKKYQDVSKKNALGIFDKNASKAMAVASIDENGINKTRIKNSMKWEMWNPWAKWFELNSTHPLISKRINRISAMSKEYNQEPYITFDIEKNQGFMGYFLFELLIVLVPSIVLPLFVILGAINKDYILRYIGIGMLISVVFLFIRFLLSHKFGYKKNNVEGLLSEVRVSHVTSVPTEVTGKIIGKGDPGCIFSEDFVIKDETGIIFLDYNQPLFIINKIFALFKSGKMIDKEVTVKGWFRRNPVPFIEIYEYTVDGQTKRIWTFLIELILYIIAFITAIVFILV